MYELLNDGRDIGKQTCKLFWGLKGSASRYKQFLKTGIIVLETTD